MKKVVMLGVLMMNNELGRLKTSKRKKLPKVNIVTHPLSKAYGKLLIPNILNLNKKKKKHKCKFYPIVEKKYILTKKGEKEYQKHLDENPWSIKSKEMFNGNYIYKWMCICGKTKMVKEK